MQKTFNSPTWLFCSCTLHLRTLVAALGASFILAACGGGGGGSADGDPGGLPAPQQAWQGTLPVEARTGQADSVKVAINASGVAYAVWSQVNGDRQQIFASRNINGAWDDALTVSRTVAANQIADLPQVVVHPDGKASAVWTQPGLFGSMIKGSSTSSDGQWKDEQLISVVLSAQDSGLQLASDGDGTAMAMWSNNGVVSASRVVGGQFELEQQVSPLSHTDAVSPAVSMRNGKALAVWAANVNGFPAVFYKTFENDAWSVNSFPLSQGIFPVETPAVALQADGKAVVAWRQANNVFARLASDAFAFVNTGWSTPPEALGFLGLNTFPTVALDAQGRALVAWEQVQGGPGNILSSRFDGSSWIPSSVESVDFDATQVRLGMDSKGQALAVWAQLSLDGNLSIFGNRMNPDTGAWGTPELIEIEDRGGAFAPSLAVSSGQEGRAVAAWKQRDGTTGGGNIQIHNIVANIFK